MTKQIVQLYMSSYSWTPEHNKWELFQMKKYLGVAYVALYMYVVAYVAFYMYVVTYVAFYMYVYIWKLNKHLNIQMCKMQVNRHTKQKYLCQCHVMSHE